MNLISLDTNIVLDILNNGLNIKIFQRGRNFFLICPFHNDKNPSLIFNSSQKNFFCFGCNFKSQNIFHFFSKFKKISIEESYKNISNLGFSLPPYLSDDIKKNNNATSGVSLLNFFISDIYQVNLKSIKGRKILNYLKKFRKISEESIEYFRLGCSIKDDQIFSVFFFEKDEKESKNFPKYLVESGLVKLKNNHFSDYFSYNNLVIPLIENNVILSFASRNLWNSQTDNISNKYIYLPNSDHFKKSHFIYNYSFSSFENEIELYLVEGFFDVISLFDLGIKNCIAVLGTNLSMIQLNKIIDLKKRIIIFPDGDRAGINFSLKVCQIFLYNKIDCELVDNNSDDDPDEICHKFEKNEVLKILNKRINPYDFILKWHIKYFDLESNPQRLNTFLLKISEFFCRFDLSIKKFVSKKISNLINCNIEEVEHFFLGNRKVMFNLSRILFLSCVFLIDCIERKILDFISKNRLFLYLLLKNKYNFFSRDNLLKYCFLIENKNYFLFKCKKNHREESLNFKHHSNTSPLFFDKNHYFLNLLNNIKCIRNFISLNSLNRYEWEIN